ncbi:MAG: class I SAM-dependent methyltransferase [Schleiferiaceae bacterium]|jgi:2-polyprenyl-3-methyl-5-hydroxy-6-metoxy-1,4-benzoquinol methylase|nr:class I SAM-dependent methyltransferase [Schleiferiaceae bacterium]
MNEDLRKQLGINEGKPNDWFETLYSRSDESGEGVPWANMAPHPLFSSWLKVHPLNGNGKKALVVGCGMGDDAIALENLGFKVTAFDVAESAIELCKKRFPNTTVNFVQGDLLAGIPGWKHQFDFVLEIFTIQALPPKYEAKLIQHVSDFVAPQGELMVITEVQKAKRTYDVGPPWLLNEDYVAKFENKGLSLKSLDKTNEPEMGDEIHLTIFEGS